VGRYLPTRATKCLGNGKVYEIEWEHKTSTHNRNQKSTHGRATRTRGTHAHGHDRGTGEHPWSCHKNAWYTCTRARPWHRRAALYVRGVTHHIARVRVEQLSLSRPVDASGWILRVVAMVAHVPKQVSESVLCHGESDFHPQAHECQSRLGP
jgi:hypothetical protein